MRDTQLVIGWDEVRCRPVYRRCRIDSDGDKNICNDEGKNAGPGVTKVLIKGRTVSLSPAAALLKECDDDDDDDHANRPALLSAFQPARFHRYGSKKSSSRLWDTLVRPNKTKGQTKHNITSKANNFLSQKDDGISDGINDDLSNAPTLPNDSGFGTVDDCNDQDKGESPRSFGNSKMNEDLDSA